jgi:hypothetical protein
MIFHEIVIEVNFIIKNTLEEYLFRNTDYNIRNNNIHLESSKCKYIFYN